MCSLIALQELVTYFRSASRFSFFGTIIRSQTAQLNQVLFFCLLFFYKKKTILLPGTFFVFFCSHFFPFIFGRRSFFLSLLLGQLKCSAQVLSVYFLERGVPFRSSPLATKSNHIVIFLSKTRKLNVFFFVKSFVNT